MKKNSSHIEVTSAVKWKNIFIWAGVILLYYMLFQAFYNSVANGLIWPYDSAADAFYYLSRNFTVIFTIFVLNYIVVFVRSGSKNAANTARISIDVALSLGTLCVVNVLYMLLVSPKIDWAGTVFNVVLILLGLEVVYYVKHYRESVAKAEAYKRDMLQYQYDALGAQVSPHFLFNSLNILYSLIEIDKEKTKEFTMALSQTYRYIMTQQGRDKARLADEISFLRAYAKVLSIRYNDSLRLEIEGEENVGDHQVISYCLQIVMENVTKHNIILPERPMKVHVVINADSVTVSNPVQRKEVTNSFGIGINYILQVHNIAGLKFSHGEENGIYKVTIPFIS